MNSQPSPAPAEPDLLNVIVRVHDPDRGTELRRAIFSLVCSEYRPLALDVVTQRFTAPQTEALRENLSDIAQLDAGVSIRFLNYTKPEPLDARSALINLGIAETAGRYLALLDYDDVVHPDGHRHLIGLLQRSAATMAIGRHAAKFKDVYADTSIAMSRKFPFEGSTLRDLFSQNFCSIHSLVLDRTRMDPTDLFFEERLSRVEDYDFLIRIGAKYPIIFGSQVVADYYLKNDESNSSLFAARPKSEDIAIWEKDREFIERRKRATHLSREVQRWLGHAPAESELTVREYLDRRTLAP